MSGARNASKLAALRQVLDNVRAEQSAVAHRIEVCERGHDPIHPPRLVPTLRAKWADLQASERELTRRIDQLSTTTGA